MTPLLGVLARRNRKGVTNYSATYNGSGQDILVPTNATGDATLTIWAPGGDGYAGLFGSGGGGGSCAIFIGPVSALLALTPPRTTTRFAAGMDNDAFGLNMSSIIGAECGGNALATITPGLEGDDAVTTLAGWTAAQVMPGFPGGAGDGMLTGGAGGGGGGTTGPGGGAGAGGAGTPDGGDGGEYLNSGAMPNGGGGGFAGAGAAGRVRLQCKITGSTPTF